MMKLHTILRVLQQVRDYFVSTIAYRWSCKQRRKADEINLRDHMARLCIVYRSTLPCLTISTNN